MKFPSIKNERIDFRDYLSGTFVAQLKAIFQRIDEDGSGQVTFEELVEGARKDKEFQSRPRVKRMKSTNTQEKQVKHSFKMPKTSRVPGSKQGCQQAFNGNSKVFRCR